LRTILLLLFFAVIQPAFADDWQPYANVRFGYAIEIPPGFTMTNEAENGDGRTYASQSGRTTLSVWGTLLADLPFREDVSQQRDFYVQDGWDISYDRTSDGWVSFSGTKDGRILYHRAIQLCEEQAAFFALDYPVADRKVMDAVTVRLVKSLRPEEGCSSTPKAAPGAN
jgi:hypothetical protein